MWIGIKADWGLDAQDGDWKGEDCEVNGQRRQKHHRQGVIRDITNMGFWNGWDNARDNMRIGKRDIGQTSISEQ